MSKANGRIVIQATIEDALHFTAQDRADMEKRYPAHEKEARLRGVPVLGSGRIFPLPDEAISCASFQIPKHWPVIGGIDFGWDHPTAAVRLAWDRESDIVYVTAAYAVSNTIPLLHAAALRPWGETMPWAWPHDGLQHDKGSGVQIAEQYRSHGLQLLPGRAAFEDGTYGLEAGLNLMLERMESGRLRVFQHLAEWFEEFRIYHRVDGKPVKKKDDLMSATRYALMCLRYAAPGRPKVWAKASSAWVV